MTPATVQLGIPGQVYLGSRPDFMPKQYKHLAVHVMTGTCRIQTQRGLIVNSQLRKDEWQRLDTEIQQASVKRLNGVARLRGMGLTEPIGSFGVLTSQWNQAAEMTAADVSMSGEAQGDRDRNEFKLVGRPVPIISKDFHIPARALEASRMSGSPLDVSGAVSASRVVVEKAEQLLFNGDSSLIFDGNTLYGYTSETNINSDTAANFGGGDWGTISNIIPTISGMIAEANSDNYYGPFDVYASTTQYAQATTNFYTDGSGQTPAKRIAELEQVNGLFPGDWLTDGYILLVQMTRDVVDWAEHMDVTVVEWMSGDGLVGHYKVLMVATPRVKSEFSGKSGVVLATGA